MKTRTSSLMDGINYKQNKVMRIDDINEMADSDIRENERLEEASKNYAHNYFDMYEINNYKALKEGFKAGYNKAKEDTNNYNVIDSDIGTIEVLHDLLLDAHGYELDSIILKRARELTAKMYKSLYNK